MIPGTRDYRDIILQLDSELSKVQDVDILLEHILMEARHVLNADGGTIYVREGDQLVFKYSQNTTLEKRLPPGQKLPYSNLRIPIDDTRAAGYAANHKVPVRIDDAYAIPKDKPYGFNPSYDKQNNWKTRSILAIPLITSTDNLIGVIQVLNAMDESGEAIPFTEHDEQVFEHFASSATDALERAFMTRAIIMRMNKMAEMRDPKETGAHVNRVAGYAAEIYDRWAFNRSIPDKEREHTKDILKMAAMLHDVGKVAISDLILKKPARFTPEEYKVMQAHTAFGARLFADPQSELDVVSCDVALRHHENWDGTGYPGIVDIWAEVPADAPLECGADGSVRKLKGEEIPLGGRIVAVADVYDALMSRRVYKEPWDSGKVYDEIRAMSGTKFDPEIVQAFFEVLPRIEEIRSRYPDAEAEEKPAPAPTPAGETKAACKDAPSAAPR
jgi:Response regulator containing a CheY-like receiver domain and an HD-GYP domain